MVPGEATWRRRAVKWVCSNFHRLDDLLRRIRLSGYGALAQLGERVLCKHEVVGSIPTGSTTLRLTATRGAAKGRVTLAQHTQEPKGGAWCPAKPLGIDGLWP
jgi:hypothetical protein